MCDVQVLLVTVDALVLMEPLAHQVSRVNRDHLDSLDGLVRQDQPVELVQLDLPDSLALLEIQVNFTY